MIEMEKNYSFVLAFCLLFFACFACNPSGAPREDEARVNLAHLDHLYGETVMAGDSVGLIAIYAEAPDYRWVEAPGEGLACVDDVARAAVVYLQDAQKNQRPESEKKLRRLLIFLLKMQAENGLFYNFIFEDHRINRTRENSRPVADWWAWRALWALAEAYPFYQKRDPDFAERLAESVQRVFPHVDSLLQHYPQVDDVDGFAAPRWLPHGAADQASVLLLALTAWYRATDDYDLREKMRRIAEGIMQMQIRQPGFFADGALLSWRNIWHGWGNSQAHALITAGMALDDTTLIDAGLREVAQFQPFLLQENFLHEIRFSRTAEEFRAADTIKFEQIAYDIRPMVLAALAAFDATGEADYARQAADLCGWFFGRNPAKKPMYDPETGRCFDGINNENEINRNAGAESTIEALLALQAMERKLPGVPIVTQK